MGLVGPPFWSGLKHLNKYYWTAVRVYRHSWLPQNEWLLIIVVFPSLFSPRFLTSICGSEWIVSTTIGSIAMKLVTHSCWSSCPTISVHFYIFQYFGLWPNIQTTTGSSISPELCSLLNSKYQHANRLTKIMVNVVNMLNISMLVFPFNSRHHSI